jgi:glycosyl transferase family 2
MSAESGPALSVIVLVPDRFNTVLRVVTELARQQIRDQIELVFVAVPGVSIPQSVVADFWGWQQIEKPDWRSSADARAVGVARARAPIVAFVEDHCFPTPGWAEALLRAHERAWAGVGPVVLNANPKRTLSWANLLIEYGPWLHPRERGTVSHIPGHNSSYKRALLMEYGDQLTPMLEAESVLHWDLNRHGHAVALEPDARSRHQNFERFGASLNLRFQAGRHFAAHRSQHWPRSRRLVYTLGSPLLPVLRTWRVREHAARLEDTRRRPWLLPLVFVLLVVDAMGEATGYAFGRGSTPLTLIDLEFHRDRFRAASDKAPA